MKKLILISGGKLYLSVNKEGSRSLPLGTTGREAYNSDSDSRDFVFGDYIATSDPEVIGRYSHDTDPIGLREAWNLIPERDYAAAVKGAELLNWSAATNYCSRCGSPMRRATEISKICTSPGCGREVFPSLWPAIVVLVIKESPDGDPAKEEALLVHARTLSRPTVQTLVAGFVETGESLEECVAREVKEETSLDIEDIRYVGSQSWPFPHQLMLGFTARYKGGAIRFADGELTSGGFFTRDRLPDLPTMPSLSRRIIDTWAKC